MNRQPARVNVKALVVLVGVVVVLGGGGAVAYKVRKRVLANRALKAGNVAVTREDWPEACKQLKDYLARYPDDVGVLTRYAAANLSVRPLDPKYLGAATGAYRRLLRHKPGDDAICRHLARLYAHMRNYGEVEYICRERLKAEPGDPDANLDLAEALIAQGLPEDAEALLAALVQGPANPVRAYALLSGLILQEDASTSAARATRWSAAAEWLDECVAAHPQSAEARALRARFRGIQARRLSDDSAPGAERGLEEAARDDLKVADGLGAADPKTRLILAGEWLSWNESDRAAKELAALTSVTPTDLAERYVDPDDFEFQRFILSGRLAIQRDERGACGDVADRALERLAGRQHRDFLPLAVDFYLIAGRITDARKAVEAFREAVAALVQATPAATTRLALIDAAVADAEGTPYRVIDLLADLVVRSPDTKAAWRLLWRAYDRVGQRYQATASLEEYVQRSPRDTAAVLALAMAYRNRQDPDWRKVFRYAHRVEGAAPSLQDAKLLRIEASLSGGAGALDEAARAQLESELAALRENNPRSTRIRELQALLALRQGRTEDAEVELKAAVKNSDDSLVAAIQLARLHVRNGQTEQAINVCRNATTQHPDAADAWLALADSLRRGERSDEARSTLQRAVAQLEGSDRVRARRALVRDLLRTGERPAAIALLQQMAREQPDDPTVRSVLLDLPEVLNDNGQTESLIEDLKRIEGEKGLRWRLAQARLWLSGDDWKSHQADIAKELETCLSADPGWASASLALGDYYKRSGQSEKAQETYERTFNANPTALEVANQLLRLLEKQGRLADAQAVLDRVRGNTGTLRSHRINVAIGRKQFGDATTELQAVVAASPDDVGLRTLLAWTTFAAGNTDAALETLNAITVAPTDRLPVSDLKARILRAAGRSDEALRFLSDELEAHDDFIAYRLRAQHLATAGEFDRAEADYKHLTTFTDSVGTAHVLLGLFYVERGRLPDAVATWEAGLKLAPDDAALSHNLIRALLASKDPQQRERGRQALDERLAEHEDDPTLLLFRSASLLEENTSKARAEARTILERLVQDHPSDVTVAIQLGRLERSEGHIERAGDLVDRALGGNPGNPLLLLEKATLELLAKHPARAREMARSLLDSTNLTPDVRARARNLETQARMDVLYARNDLLGIAGLLDKHRTEFPKESAVLLRGVKMLLSSAETSVLDRAASLLDHVLKITPDSADAYYTLARLAYLRHDLPTCDRAYRKVIELQPASADALNDYAWILAEDLKKADTALQLADRGLERFPDHIHLLDTRGVVFFRLNRLDDARADLERCIALTEDPPSLVARRTRAQALFHLARVLAAQEDWVGAETDLKEALAIHDKLSVFSPSDLAEIEQIRSSIPR